MLKVFGLMAVDIGDVNFGVDARRVELPVGPGWSRALTGWQPSW